jgi:hypothetical protein
MSREPKKKPGEAKAQRKRHKARQAVRDALAGLRRGETVYLRAVALGCTLTARVWPFQKLRKAALAQHAAHPRVVSEETRATLRASLKAYFGWVTGSVRSIT